jgi:hypothetical protein
MRELYELATPLALISALITFLIIVLSEDDSDIIDRSTRIAFFVWFIVCILVIALYALGYLSGAWR